ncbi:MAG: DUF2135 domain-containing protein, partial [Candidatus Omnitrophica bacterium]|nr:DUF2135 domain-containing protein [Candidatus Omnitrophota bacterium]
IIMGEAHSKSLSQALSAVPKEDFTIGVGECVNDSLEPSDETLNDDTYFDRYRLDWPGGDLTVTLDSPVFDEYLIILIDEEQTDVDDSATEPESITLTNVRPGAVFLFANSYDIETGSYQICVEGANAGGQIKGDLNGDGIVNPKDLLALVEDQRKPNPSIDLTDDGNIDGMEPIRLSQDWYRESEIDIAGRSMEIVGTLKDVTVQQRLENENFPLLMRSAIREYYPEVDELISFGSPALDSILQQFQVPPEYLDDIPLLILAYALEEIGDQSAAPVLADWLEANMFAELDWSRDFVTHTLKVLTGQTDLNIETFQYDIEQKFDTIAQARVGIGSIAKAGTQEGEDCERRLLITGINSDGQQETVAVSYSVRGRDIDEIISAATDPAKKQKLEQIKQGWESGDEDVYGNSDYVPIAGAQVSRRSNCAGLVIEKIFQSLAARNGIPLTIPPGQSDATSLRSLALRFGSMVPIGEIDEFTVVSHDHDEGQSSHVEAPIQSTDSSAVIWSKDNYGKIRAHTVDKSAAASGQFTPAINQYNTRGWWPGSNVTTRFYRFDPNRIVDIKLDSSRCPCNPSAPDAIPVQITQPSNSETEERVISMSGTVGDNSVTSAVVSVNGVPQSIAVSGGMFSTKVVLSSGDNTIGVTVESPDGRRGCTEKTIRSNTLKTTISVTLTWNLNFCDVDLYVTQPDNETAWYDHLSTQIGGRLDVDNTVGYGPENYFISSEEEDNVLAGAYKIGVHYYADHAEDDENPTRSVNWRVVVLLDEGTDRETRKIYTGSLSSSSTENHSPGSSGPDWSDVATIDYQLPSDSKR